MLLGFENKQTIKQKVTECENNAFPSKGHRRMDTKCVERYLMRNPPKVIQILCVDNCIS